VSILFALIPLGLLLVGIAAWAFVWAVNHDQFEDLDRAARSIFLEDKGRNDGPEAKAAPPHSEPLSEDDPRGA